MLRNKIKKLIYTTAGRHETQKSELWKWGNKDTSFFFFFICWKHCMTIQHMPCILPTAVRLL